MTRVGVDPAEHTHTSRLPSLRSKAALVVSWRRCQRALEVPISSSLVLLVLLTAALASSASAFAISPSLRPSFPVGSRRSAEFMTVQLVSKIFVSRLAPRITSRSAFRIASRSMSLSALPEDHGEYTLDKLPTFAEALVKRNKEAKNTSSGSSASVCIVVAGGGGNAISTLASTPGASSMLLEGTVTYDRKSYRDYVASPQNTHRQDFKYASLESATLASDAALRNAITYRSGSKHDNVRTLPGCIGVGCASALVSAPSPDAPSSTGFVVATRADGARLSINITMASKMANTNSQSLQRSRTDEDVLMSHLVLRSIDILRTYDPVSLSKDTHETTTTAGDVMEANLYKENSNSDGEPDRDPQKQIIVAAAERIISGEAEASILVPTYDANGASKFIELKFPIFPEGSLVFPGSFNPPHSGHIALATEAVRAAQKNAMDYSMVYCKEIPLFFELSLMNADKPTIDPLTVAERVEKFLSLENLPHQWGVLLTREPLFSGKHNCLQKYMPDPEVPPDATYVSRPPRLNFVIGTDTMVRIINPKYYGDSAENMIESLRSMSDSHFVVGGRLEQNKDPEKPAKFVTGAEELESLPEDVKGMFTILPEFRVDISSSEIREGQKTRD